MKSPLHKIFACLFVLLLGMWSTSVFATDSEPQLRDVSHELVVRDAGDII